MILPTSGVCVCDSKNKYTKIYHGNIKINTLIHFRCVAFKNHYMSPKMPAKVFLRFFIVSSDSSPGAPGSLPPVVLALLFWREKNDPFACVVVLVLEDDAAALGCWVVPGFPW